MQTRPFPFFADGRRLQGTLVLPDGAARAPAALLCHGFGSYDDDIGAFERMAELLAQAGVASLRFSFSGSDPYPEKGTIRPASHWVSDCLAAVLRLRHEDGLDGGRIGLVGMSVGGGVVVQAAALCRAVRSVVALAPVADGEDWLRHRWLATRGEAAWQGFVAQVEADQHATVRGKPSRVVEHFDVQALPDRQQWDQVLKRFPRLLGRLTLASVADTFRFKPLYYAHAVTQPLRIVHGDADESVPLDHGRWFHERAAGPKELCVLPGAPHCCWDTPFENEVQRLTIEWVRQWLTDA
jgi:dipeptidyl aminopeptidase/acylaminoacyl peptidase